MDSRRRGICSRICLENLRTYGQFLLPVLGIRDILMRIWIRASVHLTNGSGSGTNFGAKKIIFSYFFLKTYPRAHYL
jgi:hypothetical protein